MVEAIQFIHSVAPLVKRGDLSIRFHGKPKRSKETQLGNHIHQLACLYGAHRQEGIATLDVVFGTGQNVQEELSMVAYIDETSDGGRRLVILCSMIAIVMLLCKYNIS